MTEVMALSSDYVIPFISGEIVLEEPDGELVAEPENDIESGGAELRIRLEDVEGLLKIADAYSRMEGDIAEIPMLVAASRDKSDPNEHFTFQAGPFFVNIENVKLNGNPLIFTKGKDEVFVHDRGQTFMVRTSDEGYSLAVDFTREDLESHLKSIASRK